MDVAQAEGFSGGMLGFGSDGAEPGAGPVLGVVPVAALVVADPEAVCVRAERDAEQGRTEWALTAFRALVVNPHCPSTLLPRIAAGLAGLGDHASALDACREAARREPGRPEALFGVAHAMQKLGYPAEMAIPIADRAVEIAPAFLPARALLAALLREAGRGVEASDVLADAPACSEAGACRVGRMLTLFRAPSPA